MSVVLLSFFKSLVSILYFNSLSPQVVHTNPTCLFIIASDKIELSDHIDTGKWLAILD